MNLDDLLSDQESGALARFLGTHLPRRTLDLRFSIMPPNRRDKRPVLALEKVRAKLADNRGNARALFVAINDHIRAINRYPVSPQQRFSLAELCVSILAPDLRKSATGFLKEPGGIPENEHRRDLLISATAALQALLAAYQHVFAADYDKSRFWYARVRRRVHVCANRILDLIGMIQQVNALRYQPLEESYWGIANTVYCVMLEYEQVDIPLEPCGPLIGGRRRGGFRSLRMLYAGLQVPWILDFHCWPECEMPFVLDYSLSIEDGIRVSPAEGGVCGRDQALTRCYRAAPPIKGPARDPDQENGGSALLIDYHNLIEELRADFSELSKARADRNPFLVPRRFAVLDPALQLAIAHRMTQLADLARSAQPGLPSPPQDGNLRIRVGFAQIYAHLLALFSPESQPSDGQTLSDLFAHRSAVIGEDHTAAEESRWHVLEEQPGHLRLRTQETQFTHRIAIGALVAFGYGDAGIRAPSVGRVSRIHRPSTGTVLVDLVAFASFARPVSLSRDDDGDAAQDRRPIHALIVYGDDAGWGLLLPDNERFWENTQVSARVGAKEVALPLGELRDVGEGCCLFRLKARLGGGQRPTYPDRRSSVQAGDAG